MTRQDILNDICSRITTDWTVMDVQDAVYTWSDGDPEAGLDDSLLIITGALIHYIRLCEDEQKVPKLFEKRVDTRRKKSCTN